MSVTITRGLTLETIGVEVSTPATGGGQGLPSFAASVNITAHPRRQTERIYGADGNEEETTLTVWVQPDASPLPAEGDRLTYDSVAFIVRRKVEVKDFDSTIDHVVLKCREE